LTNFLRFFHRVSPILLAAPLVFAMQGAAWSQTMVPNMAPELIDAPQPQPQPAGGQVQSRAKQMTFASPTPARKYAQVIEPWQTAHSFDGTDKLFFSFREVARPITILPSLYSAGYEHLFEEDPKYGHDAGAFGEQFGASMLRRASMRVFSDGIFAAAFHQDPRYYRVATGSTFHRSLVSVSQAFVRRSDDGDKQFNWSGFAGRAASAALTTTYYPASSVTAKAVGTTFGYSIATDAGGDLLLEFLPNVIRKFPIMQKLRLE
jgi:hypothetical protein